MKFSIIIPTYNSKEYIKECLFSILKSGFNDEIIVVDNNSKDGTPFYVKNNFPKIQVIENSHNFGFGKSANIGAKKASGEYFIFLNPDTIVFQDSFQRLEDFIQKNSNFGAIGFNLITREGKHENFSFGKKNNLFQILKNKFFLKKDFLPDAPIKVDWVSGAAVVVKNEVFKKIGGFDENFFMYFEDQDLCLRIKNFSYPVYFLPNAKIIHLGGKGWTSLSFQKKYYYESQDYFFKKHFGIFQYSLMRVLRLPLKFLNSKK